MPDTRFNRAQDFVWRNARLLERHLFAYHFAGGPREPVLAALRAYRNADGGFGHGLEPDKRCPSSQPVDVEFALGVLDKIDAFDDPMVAQACDFLATITTPEGGLPFATPDVRNYPRAPWWDVPDNPPADINPTGRIAGLLLKHGVEHPWLVRAVAYCWTAIEASNSHQYHDVIEMVAFLEHAPDRPRAERELRRVITRVVGSPGAIALDPGAEGYVKKPLDWAPVPHGTFSPLFGRDVIATHLAALAARQQPDGGWPINWEPVSPGVTLEWRGVYTIDALRTLQAYGA